MSAGRLGRRGLDQLAQRLSERDRAILVDVGALRLMSTRQIEALRFSAERHASALTAARTCRRVLNRLVRDRLLIRLQHRDVGGVWAGSSSYIYALGPVGDRVVNDGRPRRRFREPTTTFVRHTLAISDLVVSLREANRVRQLELLDVQTEPSCWRPLGDHGQSMLRPDLFVRVAVGEYEYHSFIEVDLGTEGLPRLVAKCQTYRAYHDRDIEQHTHGLFPRVVWLLNSKDRSKQLIERIPRSRIRPALFSVTTIDRSLSALTEGEIATPGAAA